MKKAGFAWKLAYGCQCAALAFFSAFALFSAFASFLAFALLQVLAFFQALASPLHSPSLSCCLHTMSRIMARA